MSLDGSEIAEQDVLPIQRNPFHILGVSARDNRQRIVEAAEERSLILNADLCAKARGDLTNPRSRLAAELAWLPGLSPRRAEQLVNTLAARPVVAFKGDGLPPLAEANLMASAFLVLNPALSEPLWRACIIAIAKAVEAISAETVRTDINQDRLVAGFAEVKSVEIVEEGLRERLREYRECLRKALDTLLPQKLARVATEVAEAATEGGTAHPPALIDEMIDAYAVGVHAFLSKESENIQIIIDRVRQAASAGATAVNPLLDRLEKLIRNWYAVAKPIQIVAGAKGTSHNLSREVAGSVRDLGIFLYNEHTMLEESRWIVQMLQEAFGSLPELAERVEDDSRVLDDLDRRKQRQDKIKPLMDLCTKVLEKIDVDPLGGERQGREVLDTGKRLIPTLAKVGFDSEALAEVEDVMAVTLFRCAIALGNASAKWEKPIGLLEEARALAHDKDILGRIDTNLATARQNQRLFGDLQPISSAPKLFTYNGCGLTLYGNTDPDPASGSYVATYYFVFLFVPIFPISRYRVISSGNSYRFLGKASLRAFDKLHLALSAIGILLILLFNS